MFDAELCTVAPFTWKVYRLAPAGVAVKLTLVPAQIESSASLLTMLATGVGATVVVMPELRVEQPDASVTLTVTTWPFKKVVVGYVLTALF